MNRTEAVKLAQQIPREAWHQVRCKVGETNGQAVVHLHDTEERVSRNIASMGEWLADPLNKRNKPGNDPDPLEQLEPVIRHV